LADEPTANLDTATGLGIVKMMCRLGIDRGCTIIMATHDSEIIDTAGVIIGLKDGQVDKEGK
jgi:putative ABC transport system ATP-binding protein